MKVGLQLHGKIAWRRASGGISDAPTRVGNKIAAAEVAGAFVASRATKIMALTKPAKPPPMAGRKQEVRQLRE
jgi:hypothetical protein